MSWLALLAILLVMTGLPAMCLCPRHHRLRWGIGVLAAIILLISCALADDASRKTLQFTLMPMGLAWVLIGSLATTCFMLSHHRLGALLILAFILLALGGNRWCGSLLVANLERRLDPQASASDERYDVICVLGGGSNRRFDGAPQLAPAGDRLWLGVSLFRQQRTSLLLTTGVFAEDTRRLWEQMGVPPEKVVVESAPENTAQEIALIKRLAGERGWTRIGVVSSAWHLPRVARLAARENLSVLPLPCDWLGNVMELTGEQLVPKSDGARLIELALKEYVGLFFGS